MFNNEMKWAMLYALLLSESARSKCVLVGIPHHVVYDHLPANPMYTETFAERVARFATMTGVTLIGTNKTTGGAVIAWQFELRERGLNKSQQAGQMVST